MKVPATFQVLTYIFVYQFREPHTIFLIKYNAFVVRKNNINANNILTKIIFNSIS